MKRFLVFLVIALVLWGVIYTLAYRQQEADVEAMGVLVNSFDMRLGQLSEDQRLLLTYVIDLREKLSRKGFEVPPMPSIAPAENAENNTDEKR